MEFRAGDLALVDKTLVQIQQIFRETNQVLAYSILESRLVLVDMNQIVSRVEAGEEAALVEDVLVVSDNGERSEPGKRLRADDSRQIVSVRLKDGTVIEAPKARIVIDGSKMLTADVIIYMIASNMVGYNALDFLGKMAQINKAYHEVINSDRIWKFMITKDYNQFYLHYVDVETEELHSTMKTVLDTFTRESYKKGRRYYKRFYEFIRKIRSSKTTQTESQGKFQGVTGLKGLTKYFNAVFQCGDSVYVLMGEIQQPNSGNVLMRVPHSTDIFAMFAQAGGPLADSNILYRDKNAVTLNTYDQNGFVLSRTEVSTSHLSVWYHAVSQATTKLLFYERIASFQGRMFQHVSLLNKKSIALCIVNAEDRVFNTYIYSRSDFTLQGNLKDVHVTRAKNLTTFYALDLTKTYLQSGRDIDEWTPNSWYRRFSGVFYQGNFYINPQEHREDETFNPENWVLVTEHRDEIIEASRNIYDGSWRVPYIEIDTSNNSIVTQVNLNLSEVLHNFYPNFNGRRDEVIPNHNNTPYAISRGQDSFNWLSYKIPMQMRLLQSPLLSVKRDWTYRSSIDFQDGRPFETSLLLSALHPILDSNGLIHGYIESRRGKPFLIRVTIQPQRKTNLVSASCTSCPEKTAQFKCSKCSESFCGEECFQTNHLLFCIDTQ